MSSTIKNIALTTYACMFPAVPVAYQPAKDTMPHTLSLVPQEILQRIFSSFSLLDIRVCSWVCRQWKQIFLGNEELAKDIGPHILILGDEEWKNFVGDAGKIPMLPANIYETLKSPCPFWEGQKVWETHMLLYIPKTIDGKQASLNRILMNIKINPKETLDKTRERFSCCFEEEEEDECQEPIDMSGDIMEEIAEWSNHPIELIQDGSLSNYCTILNAKVRGLHGSTEVDRSGWVLMTKDCIPNSISNYLQFIKKANALGINTKVISEVRSRTEELIEDHKNTTIPVAARETYQIPSIIQAIMGTMLKNEKLENDPNDPIADHMIICNERVENSYVVVGGYKYSFLVDEAPVAGGLNIEDLLNHMARNRWFNPEQFADFGISLVRWL